MIGFGKDCVIALGFLSYNLFINLERREFYEIKDKTLRNRFMKSQDREGLDSWTMS